MPAVKNALAIAHMRGGYLYENFPNLFPYCHCSTVEMALWSKYYEEIESRRKQYGRR
jgi:hypothetical protein